MIKVSNESGLFPGDAFCELKWVPPKFKFCTIAHTGGAKKAAPNAATNGRALGRRHFYDAAANRTP